jgi:protein involved in polysaccharide export with SLBB domain
MMILRTAAVGRRAGCLALALAMGILTGCGTLDPQTDDTPPPSTTAEPRNSLRVGDELTVLFSGINNPPDAFRGRIREDGTINLPFDVSITAKDKTPAQIETIIHDKYVPRYYQRLNVTVSAENRFFYVDGYVKNPDRHVFAGEMTVLKAIAAAKGFNEFANRKKVKLTRTNGQSFIVNAEKALSKPQLDLPVYPGDHIFVPRKFF